MGATKKSGSKAAANQRDNAPKWRWGPRTRARYENWYGMVHQRDPPMAFWFRYTLLAHSDGTYDKNKERGAEGRVWAIYFDGEDPTNNFRVTHAEPLSAVVLEKSPPRVAIGSAGLFTNGRLTGAIDAERTVNWDLRFTPNDWTYRSVHSSLLAALVSSSRNLSPNNDLSVTGTLEIDGTRHRFDAVPGHQGHTWGRKMQRAWSWAHCNAFDNDPNAVFEGVAVRRSDEDDENEVVEEKDDIAASFYLKLDGTRYCFNRLKHLTRKNSARFAPGRLSFSAEDRSIRLEGEVTADPADIAYVRYEDVDGGLLYNRNSCLASIRLRVKRKGRSRGDWSTIKELEATRTGALEYIDRTADGHDYRPVFHAARKDVESG